MSQFIKGVLQTEFQVICAYDGEEGLRMALSREPDMIVTDLMMPRMSGDQMVVALRTQPRHLTETPILILSAKSDDALRVDLLKWGAQDYLTKPFLPDELLIRVRHLVQMKKAREQLEVVNAELAREIDHKSGALLDQQTLLEAICESTTDYICVKDVNGRFQYVNSALAHLLGRRAESILGKTLTDFFSPKMAAIITAKEKTILETGEPQSIEETLGIGGVRRHHLSTKGPLRNHRGEVIGLVCISHDITERKQAEERLDRLAHFDALTELPNRNLLYEHLRMSLSRANRRKQPLAVLFLDLDRLKVINDSLGHAMGDQLISAMASRLKDCVRGDDFVARVSGDEFIVIVEEIFDRDKLSSFAEKLLKSIARPFQLGDIEIFVTASVGISLYPQDGSEPERLIHCADLALASAKELGRNTYHYFTPVLDVDAKERLALQQDLRRAIDRNELVIYYQPKLDLKSGCLCGAEALIRWNHATLGFLPPADFIPIAEESGIIVQVDEWVMNEVCRQISVWQQAGLAAVPIAVNLSALQFRNHQLVNQIDAAITRNGIDPHCLECEITESVIMSRPAIAIEIIHSLKSKGVQISIDDFGTGYSSLGYLKRFPVDKLKIDKSFVGSISNNEEDIAIVRAILALAKAFDIKVIAEGVEDDDVLAFLTQEGCDEIQGYYYAKPMPCAEFEQMLATRSQRGVSP